MATNKATTKFKFGKGKKSAAAIHQKVSDGKRHVVGIGNLRVAILPEGNFWIAQGLEIDYVAQGTSIEDVKTQFDDGLACTIHQHLQIFGNIDNLLSPAPRKIWKEVLNPKAIHNRYSQISNHQVIRDAFGFEKVDYLLLAANAANA